MIRLKRLLVGAFTSSIAATALAAGTVALATPAQASAWDCQQYLRDRGYAVGSVETNACAQGARGGLADYAFCLYELDRGGVNNESHRVNACQLAQT
ncbi:hypothetical protein [Streptomyces sp. SBT349]|uniref:hypothetical protein n=1 Tax=Streptomyces sp. SBT349 TaxID=1580539 RepID=UPI00066D95D5|nr:hypothetical protein [Streptomyces sp. SBT349]